jgi:hypothetical protein
MVHIALAFPPSIEDLESPPEFAPIAISIEVVALLGHGTLANLQRLVSC